MSQIPKKDKESQTVTTLHQILHFILRKMLAQNPKRKRKEVMEMANIEILQLQAKLKRMQRISYSKYKGPKP